MVAILKRTRNHQFIIIIITLSQVKPLQATLQFSLSAVEHGQLFATWTLVRCYEALLFTTGAQRSLALEVV